MRLSFIDVVSSSGHVSTVAADDATVIAAAEETELHLDQNKCEIIANYFNIFSFFKVFERVKREDLSLLGTPILKGPAVDTALRHKMENLDKKISRLTLLHSHDILTLLKTPWACWNFSTLCVRLNAVATLFSMSLIYVLEMASQEC